jgi:hypothetical protein
MISPRKLVIASVPVVAVFAGFALPAAASPPATGTLTVLPPASFNVILDTSGVFRFQSTGTTVYAGDLVGAVTGTNTGTIAFAPSREAG